MNLLAGDMITKQVDPELLENPEKHIPLGLYCYRIAKIEGRHIFTYTCPFLDHDPEQEDQSNGYCHLLKLGDWMENGTSLLWDSVKECGINDDIENEDEGPDSQ